MDAEGRGVGVVVGRGVASVGRGAGDVDDGEDDSAGAAVGGSIVHDESPPASSTASRIGSTRDDFTRAVSHRARPRSRPAGEDGERSRGYPRRDASRNPRREIAATRIRWGGGPACARAPTASPDTGRHDRTTGGAPEPFVSRRAAGTGSRRCRRGRARAPSGCPTASSWAGGRRRWHPRPTQRTPRRRRRPRTPR